MIAHGVQSALQSPCAPDAVASIASHRAFVTCATPLVGRDGQISKGDLPDVLSEIFLRRGLDTISDNQKRFARRVVFTLPWTAGSSPPPRGSLSPSRVLAAA